MAAVSTATLTPPSSSHGRLAVGGDWNFSVPIDGADTPDPAYRGSSTNSPMPHRTGFDDHSKNGLLLNGFDHVQLGKTMSPVDIHPPSTGASQVHDYRYPLQQQTSSRDGSYDRSATPDLLAPKAPMLQRKDSTVSSNHDGDSVFDLYGGGRMSTVSAASLGSFAPQGGVEIFPSFMSGNEQGGMASEEPDSSKWIHKEKLERDDPDSSKWIHRDKLIGNDPDSSKWIHRDKLAKIEANDASGRAAYNANVDSGTSRWIDRDKLAKIESQEQQRAGIIPPRSRASTTSTTHRRNENENSREQKKQRVASPPPAEVEDEKLFNNPNEFSNDLRTPEEQAADLIALQNMSPSRQKSRNASSCRIPVPTASPFPIPQQYLERSTPLLRNSTPNGSDDDKTSLTDTYIRSRKRSHSAGSAFLLDDPTSALPAPGTIANPKNRSRTPGSPRKQSSSRPNSSTLKQRTRSNPQLNNRPSTSASYATHLSNAGTQDSTRKHHPEGPPPWSLSSYKPDPSLPPDQQIIPTVAKRMQQEQWERDGAPADVYDRNLRPLRVHGDEEVERARHRRTLSQEQEEKPVEWPLKSSVTSPEGPRAVKQDAGYKAMPNVNGNASTPIQPPQEPQKPTDLERGKEKKKEKKSFSCCVIC